MKVAERVPVRELTEENMAFLKQLGVDGIKVNVDPVGTEKGWGAEAAELGRTPFIELRPLLKMKEKIEGFGLKLFGISGIMWHRFDKMITGLPGRDEQIENWCKSLRNMGAAGIEIVTYFWGTNAGQKWTNWRTAIDTPGRGGALFTSFDYEKVKNAPITEIGHLSDEQLWNSLTYFLKAVIPIAEKSGVKMGLHPADPQVPALVGIARIIRNPEAFERVFNIIPSESNGMTFCTGCFTQMLDACDVYDAIRRFGSRRKIVFVHFRNVVGMIEKFAETYWDEGKLDMFKAMKVFDEVGYDGYMIPDHAPRGAGDSEWSHRARAFALGYMRGLVQAVNA